MQDNNEVTVWNLESGSKQQTLWASNAPPLSNSQVIFNLLIYLDNTQNHFCFFQYIFNVYYFKSNQIYYFLIC